MAHHLRGILAWRKSFSFPALLVFLSSALILLLYGSATEAAQRIDLAAAQPPSVEVGAAQGGTGTITGTVKMFKGGPPGFARVNACLVSAPPDCLKAFGTGPGEHEVVIMGVDSYVLTDLPAGDYKILFEGDIYQNRENVYYPNAATVEEAEPVTVVAGDTTPNINGILVGFSRITGSITDSGGNGIQGAQALVCDAGNPLTCEPPEWSTGGQSATTDASGNFDLNKLDAGTYWLRFSHPNFLTEYFNNTTDFTQATAVTVGIEGHVSGIYASLAGAAKVTGIVTSEGGGAIANARIRFQAVVGDDWHQTESNANGEYAVDLTPGAYLVQFRAPAATPDGWLTVEVPFTAQVGTATLNQTLTVGRVISGRVTLAGGSAPPPGIRVQACVTTDGCTSVFDFDGLFYDTDPNGDYRIAGLPPGSYYLVFAMANSLYLGELYEEVVGFQNGPAVDLTGATAIDLTSAFSADIDAELDMPASLVGRVTAENGGAALAGITVTMCRVTLSACHQLPPATTSATGEYDFAKLSPGTYRIGFADNRPLALYEELRPPSFTIASGEEATLNVVMKLKPSATPTPTVTPSGTPSSTLTPTKTPTPTPSPTPPPVAIATLVVMPNTAAQTTIGEAQGLKAGQSIKIELPAGAVDEPTVLTVGLLTALPAPRTGLGAFIFSISATQGGAPSPGLHFGAPVTLTITYRDVDVAGLDEENLTLHYMRDDGSWSDDGIVRVAHDLAANRLTVTIAHLTTFALFDPSGRALLPLVVR